MYFPGLQNQGNMRGQRMPPGREGLVQGGLEEASEEELQFFALDEDFEPEMEDIINMAQMLGIDPMREQNLMYIAKEGIVLPPPDPWILAMDIHEELYYVNQETEEILEYPPNIEELIQKVQMVRNRQRNLRSRDKNQKKNAMKKILGRNIPEDAFASDSNTNPSTAKKSPSKRGGRGGFGLLKHLNSAQNQNDEGQPKLGVIKEHKDNHKKQFDGVRNGKPGRVKRTNVRERVKEKRDMKSSGKFKKKKNEKNVPTDEEFEGLMSSSELNNMLDDEPIHTFDSQEDDYKTVPSSMKKGKIEGSERFYETGKKKKGQHGRPSRKEVNDIIDAISMNEGSEGESVSDMGSYFGNDIGMAIDPEREKKKNKNILFEDQEKKRVKKRNALEHSSSSLHSDEGEEGEEEYDDDDVLEDLHGDDESYGVPDEIAQSQLFSEDEYEKRRQKFTSYDTPSVRSKEAKTPKPNMKKKRLPEKSSSPKKNPQKKIENFEELQKLSHPESFPGYELVDSNILFSMVKQIEQMQNKIEGLEEENKEIKTQNDQIMRKTQLLESSTLKTVSMVSNNPWSNNLGDRIDEDEELTDELVESYERKEPPPKPVKNASSVTAEVLNLKKDIKGIKSFLEQSILKLNNKLEEKILEKNNRLPSTITEESRSTFGNSERNQDLQNQIEKQQGSLLLMNKWMNIIVKEKQRMSKEKLILKNQREKLERRKYMLKAHELEMISELQKMGVKDNHSLSNKIKRSIVMQFSTFKDDYIAWKDKAAQFKIKEKNLDVLEKTLVNSNNISNLDKKSDESLQEMYKAYLNLDKRTIDDDDELVSLSNSDIFDEDPFGMGSINLANMELTDTVELDDKNKPKRKQEIIVNGIEEIKEEENEDEEEDIGNRESATSVIHLDAPLKKRLESPSDGEIVKKSHINKNSFLRDNTMRLSNYGNSMLSLGSTRLYNQSNYLNDLTRLRKTYTNELKSKLPAETLQNRGIRKYFSEQNMWFEGMQSKLKMMKNSLNTS